MNECDFNTLRFTVSEKDGGKVFHFYCPISGAMICETGIYRHLPADQALLLAWKTEGKKHFNLCKKCGLWVSDTMYNADVCVCVDCAPWEDAPKYCKRCGEKTNGNEVFCRICKERLRYGEVWK